ncbi:MAG: metallophosphoesterase [Pseudomonadota bacterium]
MTTFRLLHSGDIHLGKPFGGYAAADRLRVARRGVIARLAAAAVEGGAAHVLIAGDLFDIPNPAAETWRQATAEMAEAEGLTWWLLPGNHDNLGDGRATWEGISGRGHPNLRVLDTAQPVEMAPGAALLPAPLTARRGTTDPTGWMDRAATPEGSLRIGLAHGSIQDFGERTPRPDIIAPDRDRRAGLDWLALGDWHGAQRIGERAAYAGTPERTGFGADGRGTCLLVEIDGPGAPPRVETVETGVFDWREVALDFVPGDDPAAMVAAALPAGARRDMLLRVVASGRLTLAGAAALTALEKAIGPEFCHFELEMTALGTEVLAADLDAVSPGGALRSAADALAARALDPDLSAEARGVAEAALRRLHSLAREEAG